MNSGIKNCILQFFFLNLLEFYSTPSVVFVPNFNGANSIPGHAIFIQVLLTIGCFPSIIIIIIII